MAATQRYSFLVPKIVPKDIHCRCMEGMTIGDWIRERRKELWMTQKKLARLVGCAPVTIQKIEEGHRRPSPSVAEALAQHLEIETHDLERFLRLAKISATVARASTAKPLVSQVPLPLTALIGRESELSSLKEMILHAPTRLFTLTGSPGMGKTRLALQLAQELRHSFVDGIFFVPLAALDNPEQVLPSIIRRLGLVDGGVQSRVTRLQAYLRDKRLLLILDNFEHLLTAAPALSGLLEQCSGLRVLATSRSALRLYGEQEWSLEPLPLPGLARVADNPAVQLFLERVRAFDPKFDLNPHNSNAIVEIVTRLEGLPLALELAAVRLRHASPEELAAQLKTQVLTALGVGPTDWSERQRTLQGAIAWSYERLEERLKRIFRQVGVFVGGFDATAATAVCEARDEDLHALLDGHLIQRDGERYSLFETLREFALEQLTTHSELEAARDAHLEHYLESVQTHERTDLDWFETEVGNLRAALRRALDNLKIEQTMRMTHAMDWFWQTRGYQHEGLEWAKAALALPGEVIPELRIWALNLGCILAWRAGVFDLAPTWCAEGLALSRSVGRTDWEVIMLQTSGKVALEQGLNQEALEMLEPALNLCRELCAQSSPNQLIDAQSMPNYIKASFYQLGTGHGSIPDYPRHPYQLSKSLFLLADTYLALQDYNKAQALAEEGLTICQNQPGLFWEPLLHQVLGSLALEHQDFRTARTYFNESLRLSKKIEHKPMMCTTLTDLAASLVQPEASNADLLWAARLWGTVEAIYEINGLHRWSPANQERIERWIEQARKRVPDLEWNLAWISGRAMTLSEALEYALTPEKVRVSRS